MLDCKGNGVRLRVARKVARQVMWDLRREPYNVPTIDRAMRVYAKWVIRSTDWKEEARLLRCWSGKDRGASGRGGPSEKEVPQSTPFQS